MYFEIYQETSTKTSPLNCSFTGKWRWRARAQNGNILADSGQGYKGGRSAVIKSIKKFVGNIRVDHYITIKDLSCGEKLTV